MAKIQCPHCKAVNQDVGMDDPCWQCGVIIGAPLSAIDTGVGPPASDANPAGRTVTPSAPGQTQIERDRTRKVDLPADKGTSRSSTTAIIAVVAVLLAMIVIVLWFYLKTRH